MRTIKEMFFKGSCPNNKVNLADFNLDCHTLHSTLLLTVFGFEMKHDIMMNGELFSMDVRD